MPTYKFTDPQSGRVIRLTGDTPPSEDVVKQAFARAGEMPGATVTPRQESLPGQLLQQLGSGAGSLVNLLFPATTSVGRQAGAGLALKGGAGATLAQTQNQAARQAQEWTRQAQAESDPQRKELLLNAARSVMGQAGQSVQEGVSGAEKAVGVAPGQQVPGALRTGLGFGLEAGALLAPAYKAGVGAPGLTGAAQRIGAAGATGAGRGAATGASRALVSPSETASDLILPADIAQRTASGALIGGVLGAGFQAAGEGAKAAAKGIKRAGSNLLSSQYNVARGQAGQLRLKDTVAELSDDYGLAHIDKVHESIPKVTGSDGAITKMTREAVANADPVQLDALTANNGATLKPGVREIAQQIVDDPSLPVGTDEKLLKEFNRDTLALVKPSVNPEDIGKADPLDVFDLIKKYEAKSANLTRFRPERATPDPNSLALGRAYEMMADELKDRLYTESNADSLILNTEVKKKLLAELSSVSPKLAKKAGDASTVQELRSLAAPFVRADRLIRATQAGEQVAQTFLPAGKGLGRVVRGQPLLGMLEPLLSSPGVNAPAGRGLQQLGNVLPGAATDEAVNLLTRLGILGAIQPTEQQNTGVTSRL